MDFDEPNWIIFGIIYAAILVGIWVLPSMFNIEGLGLATKIGATVIMAPITYFFSLDR